MILTELDKIKTFTDKGWWGDVTTDQVFQKMCQMVPDRVAVVDATNREEFTDGSPKRLTYEELNEFVDRISARLLSLGVERDDIVAIQMPNIVETVAIILACARLGLIVTPIAIQYRQHELNHIFERIDPKVFITMTNIKGHNPAALITDMNNETGFIDHIMAWGEEVPEGVVSLNKLNATEYEIRKLHNYIKAASHTANDILTICWTSGTDADPKGVPRSHNHWFAIARIIVATAQMGEGEHLVNPFPMVNMASLGGVFFPWLLMRGKLVLHQPFELSTYLKQIEDESINYNLAPPPVLNRLVKDDEILESINLSSLHSVCSGSAPLAPWMIEKWRDRFDINVINFFGSNEGTTLVSSAVDVPNPHERAIYFPRFGVPEFKWAVDDVISFRTRLVNPDTGVEVTRRGEQGELRIWGATVFDGYYGEPALNETVFDEDGYFCTGDLFEIAGTEDNPCYYSFVGRLKEIIIRGGQNISPSELDSLLESHPKVAEAAVAGIPDDIMGERVCAVVVPVAGECVELVELNDYLRGKNIAVFKLPECLLIADSLPRNQLDKIVRQTLKERIIDQMSQAELSKNW